MRRIDLIKYEEFIAATYRREASNRRSRNPALADRYAEYAAALYDTASEQPEAPADEQAALL